mgnify:CR=1 FL=1
MAEIYRVPKSILDEGVTQTTMTFAEVVNFRDTWQGVEGKNWAEGICQKVENRLMALIDPIQEENATEMPDLADELNELLADVILFYFKAHSAHWNVIGPDFAEYHALFAEIYEDVYGSVDPIAENVRKLGKPTITTLANAVLMSEVPENNQNITDARDLAKNLLETNNLLIDELAEAFNCATMCNQQGIANFLAERIDAHQKWKWQLSSSLGTDVIDPTPMIEDQIIDSESVDTERKAQISLMEERKTAISTAEKITMQTEIRALDTEDGSLRIGGYAATFNSEATGLSFREVIAPGAFTRTLQSGNPVFLLVNHDMESLPLASTQSGTLQLAEDGVGLRMEAELDPANPRAQELASALRRGDVNKMSFAFTVAPDGQTREEGLRTLTDLDLYEVSVVTLPAYDSTTVGMRQTEDLEIVKRKLKLKATQYSLRQKHKA